MRWISIVLLVACGGGQKVTPPKQLPVTTVADVQGRWVADDEMDFAYSLTIAPDGALDAVIDRNKLGRCEIKGTLEAAGASAFKLNYGRNECEKEASHRGVVMKVPSFTGDELTVVIEGVQRTYRRAPSESANTPQP